MRSVALGCKLGRMDDATTGPSVPPLQESLGQLKAITKRYRGAKAHWVSDFILYNFAMDVRKQRRATFFQVKGSRI